MSTYTQILYQVVFGTKMRARTLTKMNREKLFQYIAGVLINKKCFVYVINGVEDHIHLVFSLHPTVSLASLVKDIKLSSAEFIIKNKLFSRFNGWQDGYGAFTYSVKEKDALINYVMNQEEHHRKSTFIEEYKTLLKEVGLEADDRYIP